MTELYDPKAFITHAASLRQAFAHCAKFPTAASRRSLGRVSVPVWPYTLSSRLPIITLVGHYPTNKLIGRRLILKRRPIARKALTLKAYTPEYYAELAQLSLGYSSLEGRLPTCYSPVRHSPQIASYSRIVRLACVRHAANVHSEPGSNSPIERIRVPKNSYKHHKLTNWIDRGRSAFLFQRTVSFYPEKEIT